jgi:MFS family permease
VFLKQIYAFENNISTTLPSMMYIGMCFGAPVLSLLAEKTNYLATIIGAGVIMACSFGALLTGILSFTTIGLLFVIVGVCSAYQIIAIYKASTYVSDSVAGLTTAITNMIIMFFGYIFHTLIGGTVHHLGGVENSDALLYGISIIPIALAIGSIGFIFMIVNEKRKPQ